MGPMPPYSRDEIVGVGHLTEHLGLAQDHRVEPGTHAEEVRYGFPVLSARRQGKDLRFLHPGGFAHEIDEILEALARPKRHRPRVCCRSKGWRSPRATARPDPAFAGPGPARRDLSLSGEKRQFFAEFDRGLAMGNTQTENARCGQGFSAREKD